VPRDEALAARWYVRAAEAGYPDAQLAAAIAYHDGAGVPKNLDLARRYARGGAEAGLPAAQFFLAMLLLEGHAEGHQEGLGWLARAAEQGYPRAVALVQELEKKRPS
jgi:hypothetical protein